MAGSLKRIKGRIKAAVVAFVARVLLELTPEEKVSLIAGRGANKLALAASILLFKHFNCY